MIEPDEVLVSQSRAGNRAAFEELVRRTARLVYSRIYLEVADGHRAEDLVQETYLTAWRAIGQVTDASGFRPWLLRVAHSTVVDAQRREMRKKRSARLAQAEALEAVASSGALPDEDAERNDERQRVLSALRSLPEEYREPLMLRYLAGADYQSISRQLGLSNGSLRGLLHRGMEMLRREMSRGPDEKRGGGPRHTLRD